MKWNPFISSNGETYGLSHLDSFDWTFSFPNENGEGETKCHFHVNFSMHCFSRKLFANEVKDDGCFYNGPNEKRVFCIGRYELSKQLPEIIRSLNERVCWHTHHNNFFTIEIFDQDGNQIEYEVFFDITKSGRQKGWLHLIVQSAYQRDAAHMKSRPKKRKIRLEVLARNKLTNKVIKPPP